MVLVKGKAAVRPRQPFGRWKVVKSVGLRGHNHYWQCRCECGTVREISTDSLVSGKSQSCGCLAQELRRQKARHGNARTGKVTREYRIWNAMHRRCSNPRHKHWHRYGGRGITVCCRWTGKNGFSNFLADMGKVPDGLTLERLNNDKGYAPSNCVWATRKQQGRNTSRIILVTVGDRTQCVQAWLDENGIPMGTYLSRLSYGWSRERAVSEPRRGQIRAA